MNNLNRFRYLKTSPEIIRLAVMAYVRIPLFLRNVEDLLHERRIDICHETVRYWRNKISPMCPPGGAVRRMLTRLSMAMTSQFYAAQSCCH